MYRKLAEVVKEFHQGIRDSRRPEDRKLAADYVAALAPLLAGAILGEDILSELPKVDRLLGQTWLIDDGPFRKALEGWKQFRNDYAKFALSSMTVNERLLALGTLEAFESAVASRDVGEMRRLLTEAYVDEPSVNKMVDNLI